MHQIMCSVCIVYISIVHGCFYSVGKIREWVNSIKVALGIALASVYSMHCHTIRIIGFFFSSLRKSKEDKRKGRHKERTRKGRRGRKNDLPLLKIANT